MPQGGQQGLDAHQALQQVAIAAVVQVRQVQPGAEVAAFTAQHQGVAGAVGAGGVHRVDQGLDEVGAQRIAALCAAQRQRGDAVGVCAAQHAVGVRAAQHAGTLS